MADYNLDGYPDIVTIIKDSATQNITSIILKNQECVPDKNPCTYNRTFTPKDEEIFVSAITNATLAVFFDVLENVNFFDQINLSMFHRDRVVGLS